MQCPVCPSTNLVMSERQGIEIDYCPTCRGIWLDRGELDKIIDRSRSQNSFSEPVEKETPKQLPSDQHYGQYRDKEHYKHHNDNYGHHYKKKKSLLEQLFD